MWSGGEINEKTAYIQARSSMARALEVNGKHAKLKEKHKWSNEKLHLENARKLRGIYFIDPEDKNSKKPSRTRVRSWKHQWLLLCREKL